MQAYANEQAHAHAALVFRLFAAVCGHDVVTLDGPMFDHHGEQPYIDAQRALLAWGMITVRQCVREV